MMEKKVFLLGDFVGYGNVAMATSRAVLTRMGFTVFCLPTALISNTWNFGTCAVLDTTDYLRRTVEVWDRLGFSPDGVVIGYLADDQQARWAAEQCGRWSGATCFLDPIFADNGALYRGIGPEWPEFLRTLLPRVDYVLPNATEACLLTGAEDPARALTLLNCPGAVITGVSAEDGQAVLVRDGKETAVLPYTPVPGRFSGAGDAFTALFAGYVLQGRSAVDSARAAMETTERWIRQSVQEQWDGMGLPVERYFRE